MQYHDRDSPRLRQILLCRLYGLPRKDKHNLHAFDSRQISRVSLENVLIN